MTARLSVQRQGDGFMRQWVLGAVIGLIAIIGLIAAASAHGGFWHIAGFAIAGLAIFLCFRLIARAYDGPGQRTPLIPVPDSDSGRQWLGGVAAVLGLIGLFLASDGHDGGQTWIGLLLTFFAWLYVFRLISVSFRRQR